MLPCLIRYIFSNIRRFTQCLNARAISSCIQFCLFAAISNFLLVGATNAQGATAVSAQSENILSGQDATSYSTKSAGIPSVQGKTSSSAPSENTSNTQNSAVVSTQNINSINTEAEIPSNKKGFFSWFTSSNKKSENDLSQEQSRNTNLNNISKSQAAKHNAAFGTLIYYYFQEDYQQVLQLIEVGRTQHGFSELSKDDTDRLNLIQGAAQLQLGMYTSAQAKFESLLSQTTSNYVQANTWFFMAKAGFENKQSYLSERAYEAILKNDLRDVLSSGQWHELLYLTAHTRMQLQQDWQSLAVQIPSDNIYSAYLLANMGTIRFNEAQYEQASDIFTQAKQSLISHQSRKGRMSVIASDIASNMFDSLSWLVRPWAWFSGNYGAQRGAKERQQFQSLEEQNALFDRINIGLGQSLLQQGDLLNAIAVIENISDGGAQSQQALLTFGWANARENRWQTAMAAWQHLQQNSVGLISLQASYGLAYALSQQDNLGQAFFALQSTATQIDTTLVALNDFALTVAKPSFFSEYQQQWPRALGDIQLGFFAPTQNFDAIFLLNTRMQAQQMQADILVKQNRVVQLNTLLKERELVYKQRLQSVSLSNAKSRLNQAQQDIDNMKALVLQANTFEKQLALSKKMSASTVSAQLTRLASAQARHERLKQDTTRKRPLKASYQERLDIVQGILTWQLMDSFIAQQWQHQKLLGEAQTSLNEAQNQYDDLQNTVQDQTVFSEQRAQFTTLNDSLSLQFSKANNIYESATAALTQELLSLIETRRSQLQTQSVNTRLAMLRIQDLKQQGGER